MNSDIRMAVGYPDHPKTRKLLRRLGAEGIKSHVFLLCKIGHLRPKGILTGYDADDIEDTAQWTGEQGEFVKALLEIGFLDEKCAGQYELHDWKRWNPWAFGAEKRRDQGRRAANSRWHPDEDDLTPETPHKAPAKKKASKKKASKKKAAAPPPPDDPPADAGQGQLVTVSEDVKAPAKIDNPESKKAADQVLAAWNTVAKKKGLKSARRLSPGRRTKINNRLKDKGWEWQAAITHLEKTLPDWDVIQKKEACKTFLQGGGKPWKENEDPWIADFDFFIRGASVDKILEGKYDPQPGALTVIEGGMSQRNHDVKEEHKAGTDWASRKEDAIHGNAASDS